MQWLQLRPWDLVRLRATPIRRRTEVASRSHGRSCNHCIRVNASFLRHKSNQWLNYSDRGAKSLKLKRNSTVADKPRNAFVQMQWRD